MMKRKDTAYYFKTLALLTWSRYAEKRKLECCAATSVVFAAGSCLCFQSGNVQAQLNHSQCRASQRLHCLNSG